MKKIFLMFITITVFTLSVCGCRIQNQSVQKPQPESVLDEYLENIDEYEIAVRDFGKPASYIHMDEKLVVGILYPETDYPFINEAINQWINETADNYIAEASGYTDESELSELTVSYDSYSITQSTVSIKLSGTFFSPNLAHPVDIIKTFNADIETQQFLSVKDIIKNSFMADFLKIILEKSGVQNEDVDAAFFNNLLLTKNGIEIILNRGDYLPMSAGTKKITLSFDELSGMLARDLKTSSLPPAPDNSDDTPAPETPSDKPSVDPNKPMLALTFDDGPSTYTDRLLDLLEHHGGKGTFFVLGNMIGGREDTLRRIYTEGHEIGNHSWSHRQLTTLPEKEITDEIMMTRAKIYDITGADCLIVRPPYGSYDEKVKEVGKELGVYFVNWSVDTLDWEHKDASAVYDEVMKSAKDGSIILCHDLHKTTVDAMVTVIPKLIESGYQLVTVSELMEHSKTPLEPGNMYYMR